MLLAEIHIKDNQIDIEEISHNSDFSGAIPITTNETINSLGVLMPVVVDMGNVVVITTAVGTVIVVVTISVTVTLLSKYHSLL